MLNEWVLRPSKWYIGCFTYLYNTSCLYSWDDTSRRPFSCSQFGLPIHNKLRFLDWIPDRSSLLLRNRRGIRRVLLHRLKVYLHIYILAQCGIYIRVEWSNGRASCTSVNIKNIRIDQCEALILWALYPRPLYRKVNRLPSHLVEHY